MNPLFLPILALLLAAFGSDSSHSGAPSIAYTVTDVPGLVIDLGDIGSAAGVATWGIRSLPDSTLYLPDDLPEDLRSAGVEVTFSGDVPPISPLVRLPGLPIYLTDIDRL